MKHTIKSAAMVVPLDEVTQLFYVVEDLLEVTLFATDRLPRECLSRYADILSDIARLRLRRGKRDPVRMSAIGIGIQLGN